MSHFYATYYWLVGDANWFACDIYLNAGGCYFRNATILEYAITKANMLYIENNRWARGDIEFIFECSHRYRTSEHIERVRFRM